MSSTSVLAPIVDCHRQDQIHLLDLSPSLLTVPLSAPAARNRFLHLPGSHGIHRIPSSPLDVATSLWAPNAHLGRTLLSALLQEPLKRRNRPLGIDDESVNDFITRRFGAEFARVFGSALVHGIYAADSRKLSLRATFPFLWDAEERGRGSVLLGSLRAPTRSQPDEDTSYDLGDLRDKMRDVSVYTFQNGMATLVNALVNYLRKQPNIHMYSGVTIMALRLNQRNNRFEVITPLNLTSLSDALLGNNVITRDPLSNSCCLCSSPPGLAGCIVACNTVTPSGDQHLLFRNGCQPRVWFAPILFASIAPRRVRLSRTPSKGRLCGKRRFRDSRLRLRFVLDCIPRHPGPCQDDCHAWWPIQLWAGLPTTSRYLDPSF